LFAETKDNRVFKTVAEVAAMRLGRTYQSHCDFITGVYFARVGNKKPPFSSSMPASIIIMVIWKPIWKKALSIMIQKQFQRSHSGFSNGGNH